MRTYVKKVVTIYVSISTRYNITYNNKKLNVKLFTNIDVSAKQHPHLSRRHGTSNNGHSLDKIDRLINDSFGSDCDHSLPVLLKE